MAYLLVSLQMLVSGAKDRLRDDEGAIAIEYAIMAVVIAMGLIAAAGAARGQIIAALQKITGTAITDDHQPRAQGGAGGPTGGLAT